MGAGRVALVFLTGCSLYFDSSHHDVNSADGGGGGTVPGFDGGAAPVIVDATTVATDGTSSSVDASPPDAPPAVTNAVLVRGANTDTGDGFGASIAISADGSTLAVGADCEDGGARGINQPDLDNWAGCSGAVYVFTRQGATWQQEAYVKASNARAGNYFGTSVALSADGSTLAVGAPNELSLSTGINGDQDQGLGTGGAAYVFVRKPYGWSQQAYIKPDRQLLDMGFGSRVALSASGDALAVGAPGDWGPDRLNGDEMRIGSVYVYARTGVVWREDGYLQAAVRDFDDMLGSSLAMSPDGTRIAAGAPNESGAGTGTTGDPHDNSAPGAGAVYIFTRGKHAWRQDTYLKASNTDSGDVFGYHSLSFSPDGNALAVTASDEQSSATGVNGDQTDNSMAHAGAAYLFHLAGGQWTQDAYLKASDTRVDNEFGYSVAMSATSLVIGAVGWANYPAPEMNSGSAYVFSRAGTPAQTAYLQSPMPAYLGQFGRTSAISADGSLVVIGAPYEPNGGSVYVFAQ